MPFPTNLPTDNNNGSSIITALQYIYNAVMGLFGGTLVTYDGINATISGTVADGKNSVTFTTSATFTGSINGLPRAASTSYCFTAGQGQTIKAIPYVITTGSIVIDYSVVTTP